MKYLFILIICLLSFKYQQSAPALMKLEDGSLSKKMKALSKLGEEYVAQEIKKALLGIKQMKTMMERNEEKHEEILKSLKKTKEEKMEAVRLFEDINEKLSEAEMHCKHLLKNVWDGCTACLEWSCIVVYTNSCPQQAFQTFVFKAEELSQQWELQSLVSREAEEKYMSSQLSGIESTFRQLMSDVSAMFNETVTFFKNVRQGFDDSFQKRFASDVNGNDTVAMAAVPTSNPIVITDYFEYWDFSGLLQGLYDFGQNCFEFVSDVFVTMYKNIYYDSYDPQESKAHLRSIPSKPACSELQNTSGCWPFQDRCQLCYESVMKDCPELIELHMKSEAAVKLVNLSTQQYDDIVGLAQQHTEDTFQLVGHMKDRYGWIADHSNKTFETGNMFNVEKVSFSPNNEHSNLYDTIVEVRIFMSPNFTIRVPGSFDIDSPQFIQYIAEEALEHHRSNF